MLYMDACDLLWAVYKINNVFSIHRNLYDNVSVYDFFCFIAVCYLCCDLVTQKLLNSSINDVLILYFNEPKFTTLFAKVS